jgi:hypothetical protein
MSMSGLALAALLTALAVPSRAAASFTPAVLQCDGSYLAGSATRHPTPLVRVDISDAIGMKIGTDRTGIVSGATRALWRFDSGVTAVEACFASGACGSGFCRRVMYLYSDPNGSQDLELGRCTYDSSDCSDDLGLVGGQSRVPLSLGACPASPASGTQSIFAASTLNAARFNNMATSAGSPRVAISTQQTIDWDLGPTYTLSAWVRGAGGGRILTVDGTNGKFWTLGVTAGGALRHRDSRDTGLTDTSRGSGLTDGGWHLLHVTRSNGATRNFFIDGRFVGSAVATTTNSFTAHPILSSAAIGGLATGGEYYTGDIDEVRVLTVALSTDDVQLEYNATAHKYSSNAGVTFSTVAGSYTPVTPPTRTYGPVTYVPGEAWTANSRWVFMSQSTFSATTLSTTFSVNRDNSPPTPPATFGGSPTTTNDVTWTWSAPTTFCGPPTSAVTYTLVDPQTGLDVNPPGPLAHPTFTVGENFAGGPNQLKSRAIKSADTWGTSILSAAATVYTLAAVPTGLSFSAISTGSFTVSWNANGNPAYTRFEVSYSPDNFASVITTPVALGADFNGTSVSVGSLSNGTTYFVRVRAYNGRSSDFFGGAPTAFLTGQLVTNPGAPVLSATPLSNSSIRYDWTAVPGATGYTLYGAGGAPVLYVGAALTFTSATLSVNSSYGAEVEAITPSGPGARGSAFAFTHANAPTTPSAPFINTTSITWAWAANGNPGYTFYELNVATDAAFSAVIATVPANATQATVSSLLPGTTYYARVRAISGSQNLTAYQLFAATVTNVNTGITQNPTGGTPYALPLNLAGQWHFDESTGATTADLSGNANVAYLTCLSAGCVSTPTFTAGPPGLGTAASINGVDHGLVRVPDAAAFNFAGDVTVVAWAYPTTTAQPNGAGIVVRGNGGAEDWALEVSGQRFRFMPHPGAILTATTTIPANAWTHLIGSYDAATGSATLYINGRLSATTLGVPARNNFAHDISIGNRQSAAASYDRGFIGRVDGVRLFSRDFTAAEALAEYASNAVSTVSASPPNDRVQVGFPPAAFGAPAVIYVSANPAAAPIRVSPAALDAGLSSPPEALTFVPNTLVEIVPVVGGQPFTQDLGSSATVSIAYDDDNGDNIIDGTAPPLPASGIRMYTLNTTVNRWELLPTTLDTANKRAVGVTPHFSVFGLFAPSTIGSSLSQVRAYPIPWKPGSVGMFDAAGVTFDRLPADGSVTILSAAGEEVAEFRFTGALAGRVVWDGRNNSGRRVASGVYYARVKSDSDNATALLRIAIER